MQKNHCTVAEWVELFEAVGLDEKKRHAWHAEFERRHPEAHEGFLTWLGLGAKDIAEIRSTSRMAKVG